MDFHPYRRDAGSVATLGTESINQRRVEKHHFSTGATRLPSMMTAYNPMTVDLRPYLRTYMAYETAVNITDSYSLRRRSRIKASDSGRARLMTLF